jgi:CRISPR-associated protein Csb1
MSESLTLDHVRSAVSGNNAAFRRITEYQPADGPGGKIFPATYEGGKYATEERILNGEKVPCVLIDSVQSQANRIELALLEAWERGRIPLPVIRVEFRDSLPKPFRVTSLDAPHRIADALLRDSLLEGTPFRKSSVGSILDVADARNAVPLLDLCPTALILGMWDSTGPRGGLGVKIQRALVSEIVGINAVLGKKTSSRIDPAQILKGSAVLYVSKDENGIAWTSDAAVAAQEKSKPKKLGKEGKPSEANHGNVTPTIADGGFTIDRALQATVLSLPALRRLRFPLTGDTTSRPEVDDAARTALVALALCGATLAHEAGADLRSRCLLVPTTGFAWELLGSPGALPVAYKLTSDEAVALLKDAVAAATAVGLPWRRDPVDLQPSTQLLDLVRRSQILAESSPTDEAE